MKILYAIQGTGNGHLTVALEALPHLMQKADVDILVSGTEVDLPLPYDVKFRLHGLCFIFGKKGGIDYLETYKRARLKRLFEEIRSLPVDDYDLVISDFEPVSAWACYLKGKPCIGFSHQAAVVNKRSPKPKSSDVIGPAVLRYYAPVSERYGFHFVPYNKNIFTPIIRRRIREANPTRKGHYTVYLPAFSEKRIVKLLSQFPDQRWEVFSKRRTEAFADGNIAFYPLGDAAFVNSLLGAEGVFCGAGFQTPAEAIFLRKKLLVIPMKGQYEQQCNAAALKLLGIPVIKNIKRKQYRKLKDWLESDATLSMDYPDDTAMILDEVIDAHAHHPQRTRLPAKDLSTAGRFRSYVLKKIFAQSGT